MPTHPKTILISRKPGTATADVAAFVRSIGHEPLDHDLGSVPAIDLEKVAAAFVVPGEQFAAAAAQTNRWRVELGDQFLPIIWVLDSSNNNEFGGLADAIFHRPLDLATLTTQLKAFERIQIQMERLRDRAGEVGGLAEKLGQLHDLRRRDAALAYSILNSFETRPSQIGALQFGYCRDSGPSLLDVGTDGDLVRIVVARVEGDGGLSDCLNAMLVRQLARPGTVPKSPPGEVLQTINRELLARKRDFLPVQLSLLDIDSRSGKYRLAQAGMADPVIVLANGDSESIAFLDPHLGMVEIQGATREGQLFPGDKIILGTDVKRSGEFNFNRDVTIQEVLDSLHLPLSAVACAVGRTADSK